MESLVLMVTCPLSSKVIKPNSDPIESTPGLPLQSSRSPSWPAGPHHHDPLPLEFWERQGEEWNNGLKLEPTTEAWNSDSCIVLSLLLQMLPATTLVLTLMSADNRI